MNYALILAGGKGHRMGDGLLPKQFLLVNSKPIIVYTIEHFQNCNDIDGIVVVCIKEYISLMQTILKQYGLDKVVSIVQGGESGQKSIYLGLCELIHLFGKNNNDILVIHDGVRPLISAELISNSISNTKMNGNSIAVAKATETIAQFDSINTLSDVLDREKCCIAKAPQCFYLYKIYENHLKAISDHKNDFVDSASLMQYYGEKLYTIICSNENIKITTPIDYYLFKSILDLRESKQFR